MPPPGSSPLLYRRRCHALEKMVAQPGGEVFTPCMMDSSLVFDTRKHQNNANSRDIVRMGIGHHMCVRGYIYIYIHVPYMYIYIYISIYLAHIAARAGSQTALGWLCCIAFKSSLPAPPNYPRPWPTSEAKTHTHTQKKKNTHTHTQGSYTPMISRLGALEPECRILMFMWSWGSYTFHFRLNATMLRSLEVRVVSHGLEFEKLYSGTLSCMKGLSEG